MGAKIVVMFLSLALMAIAASAGNKNLSICSRVNSKLVDTDQDLCRKMMGKTHSWSKAMTKMLGKMQAKLQADKHIAYGVGDKLPKSIDAVTREETGLVCKQMYDKIIDNINEYIESVKADPHGSGLYMAYGAEGFEVCTDYLHQQQIKLPEADKLERELIKFGTLLTAMDKLER